MKGPSMTLWRRPCDASAWLSNKRMDAVGARPSVAAGLARPGVAP